MKELRVLLVEDNPDHAELFLDHMHAALNGTYSLTHASSLKEGVEALRERPDVVFLDLKLPDSAEPKDTVAEFLRHNPNAPVIVLTSMSDEEMGSWAIQSGAQDYLSKDGITKSLLSKSISFALERQSFNAGIRKANQVLKESNEQLERFAFIASHDLQEPLRKINSFSQMIVEDCGTSISDKTKQYLSVIGSAAKRMTAMIDDLLALSKVERRELSMNLVALGTVVMSATENLDLSIKGSRARIDVGDLPDLVCDKSLFIHLFQNIIGNAIKFQKEGVDPEIKINASATEGGIEIVVADNGIGIAAADRQKIFEIFLRLHGHSQYPGTGIGLAICKKIVDRHEGRIWVESSAEAGSAFHVLIPQFSGKKR